MKVTNIDWEPDGCQAKVSLEDGRTFPLSREGIDQCRLTQGVEVILGPMDGQGEPVFFNGQHVTNIL
ncbi:MAG: hypothetical protein WC831_05650 [Parcubacteria group bacterium]